ncbi:MAG: endonuclease dU [Candidatus Methanogasteraceae archaeon]
MHIKPEIRILAIDDSALVSERIMIVGVVFRGGAWVDGVLKSEITQDGTDATDVAVEMLTATRHYPQIRVIMLDGVTYGGFNVVDIKELHERTRLPAIVVMRAEPDMARIGRALQNLPDFDSRWHAIQNAGKIHEIDVHGNLLYIQCAGIEITDAAKILRLGTTHRHILEPLRVAHLIATGIVCGESRGAGVN